MRIQVTYSEDEVQALIKADLAAKFPGFRVENMYEQYGSEHVRLTNEAEEPTEATNVAA